MHADLDPKFYNKSFLHGGRRKRGRPKKEQLDEEEKRKAEDEEIFQNNIRKLLKQKDINFFTHLKVIGGPSNPLEWYFEGTKDLPIRKVSTVFAKIEQMLYERK